VRNFLSYIYEEIDFTKIPSPVVILGENGSGKSAILDMITTALFYRTRGVDNKGAGIEDLITDGADFFEITYEFKMGNDYCKVFCKKTRKGNRELEFYINGINQAESITETEKKIVQVLKMDYETSLDTICIGQGKSGLFMEKKPNERKDVITQIVNLNDYEKAEKHTNELKKAKKQELEKLEEKEKYLNDSIKSYDNYILNKSTLSEDIEKNNKLLHNKEIELEQILKQKVEYEQLKSIYDNNIKQKDTIKQRIQQCELELKDFNSKLSNFVEVENNINKEKCEKDNIVLEEENNNHLSTKQEISNKIAIYENKISELKQKYSKLKNNNETICDKCYQTIDVSYKENTLKEIKTDGETLKEKKLRLDKKLEEVNNNIINNNKLIKSNKALIQEYNDIETKNQQIVIRRENTKERIKDAENNLNNYKKQLEEIIDVDIVEQKSFNDVILKQEIQMLKSVILKSNSELSVIEDKLITIEENKIIYQNIIEQIDSTKQLLEDYTDLELAFGKSGIQAIIIENILPEIEKEINKILNIISNGQITVEFKTQKDKKKSKKITSIETLDIIINDGNNTRKYELYSGGQKFRIDFAIHVGLSMFLANRSGSKMEFFMVDEGIGSQDFNARNNFIQTIYSLSSIFEKILIISHIEDIKESFENKLLVTKDPINGSKIQMI